MQIHSYPASEVNKFKCRRGAFLMPTPSIQIQSFPQKIIKPIPILYVDKLNGNKKPATLALKAYKNLSRLTASGEYTAEKLKAIKRAHFKLIRHFSFDPFLSDHSDIMPLLPVLQKLKMIKSLSLVIRRVEKTNESNLIAPFLCHFNRLKYLYMEFPSTQKVDIKGIEVISIGLSKCLSIEFLNMNFIYLPGAYPEDFFPFFSNLKHLQLKKLIINKLCHHLRTGTIDSTVAIPKLPKMSKLKTLVLKKGTIPGWVDLNSNEEAHFPCYLDSLGKTNNLENFTYIFEFFSFTTEILLNFAKVLSTLEKLRSLSLEFIACRLSDLEFMILLEGIEKCQQISQLSFKVIQSPNADEEQIIQIANLISNIKNLEKFDLYLRGKMMFGRQQLIGQLSKMENLGFSIGRKSVHIYRKL